MSFTPLFSSFFSLSLFFYFFFLLRLSAFPLSISKVFTLSHFVFSFLISCVYLPAIQFSLSHTLFIFSFFALFACLPLSTYLSISNLCDSYVCLSRSPVLSFSLSAHLHFSSPLCQCPQASGLFSFLSPSSLCLICKSPLYSTIFTFLFSIYIRVFSVFLFFLTFSPHQFRY